MTKNFNFFLLFLIVAIISGCNFPAASQQKLPAPEFVQISPTDDEGGGILQSEESESQANLQIALPPGIRIFDYPGIKSISLATGTNGLLNMLWGQETQLFLLQSSDYGVTFSDPLLINENAVAKITRYEIPIISANENGNIAVSWVEQIGRTQNIWYAYSTDNGSSFSSELLVAQADNPEFVNAQLFVDETGNATVAWLGKGVIGIAHSDFSGTNFSTTEKTIGNGRCECCSIGITASNGQTNIAYRNLQYDANNRDIRDIYVASSYDGGDIYVSNVNVNDVPWYVAACPTSGPIIQSSKDVLYITWMDGRNDGGKSFSSTDIWFALSVDGGRSFSNNIRINHIEGIYNNLPAMVIGSDGTIHISWQSIEGNRHVLYYRYSKDGGATFSNPIEINASEGLNVYSSMAIDSNSVIYLGWMKRSGSFLAIWQSLE